MFYELKEEPGVKYYFIEGDSVYRYEEKLDTITKLPINSLAVFTKFHPYARLVRKLDKVPKDVKSKIAQNFAVAL